MHGSCVNVLFMQPVWRKRKTSKNSVHVALICGAKQAYDWCENDFGEKKYKRTGGSILKQLYRSIPAISR
jgi:hypothetical protein